MTRKLKRNAPAEPTSPEPKAHAKPYEVTPRERASAMSQLARMDEMSPSPRLKITGIGNSTNISLDHPNPTIGKALIMEALGTASADFADEILLQLGNVGTRSGRADEGRLNFLLAVVKGVKPRDQLEAMLAAQMAAVHIATMTFAGRLANTDCVEQTDSAERALNRLARTFTAQVEALSRYRGGGEQRVVVQHQHVNVAANQAQVNVGAPTQGGVSPKSTEQSHEKPAALTYAPEQAMPCAVEANREAVSGGCSDRLGRLPQSRGRSWRAQGQ